MRSVKFLKRLIYSVTAFLFLTGTVATSGAMAQTQMQIEAVPTGWLLQDYVGAGVWVYFTGSPCTSGNLSLPTTATSDEVNRFFSLIMSAKISGQAVGVYYTYNGNTCVINSFYLKTS